MGKKKRKRKPRRPQAPPAVDIVEEKEVPAPPAKAGRKRRPGIAIVLAVLAAAAAAVVLFLPRERRVPVTRDSGMNVLLITLDTTRADHLGCYGYEAARTPYLDELAANGILFSNAYCQVPMTLPSHCSILTGLNPLVHGVHNNGTYILDPKFLTLAEILRDRDFQTAAFTASYSVDSRFGLDQGFDIYDDSLQEDSPFKPVNAERPAGQVFASFSAWLDQNGLEPFFTWVHFFDPHLPYNPPPDVFKDFADRPYDGEIAYMDRYVGEVVRALKERDLYEKTLIVIAGDHGEALGEREEIGHGIFLYEPTVRVPVIFHAKAHLPSGKVVDPRIRLVDLVPTILDLLEIPPVAGLDGVSLVSHMEGRRKDSLDSYLETFYPRENHGWSELTGLVSGEWKYIEAPRPELYHLGRDPDEKNNLIAAETATAETMKEALEEKIRRAAGESSGARELTAEEREKLRSLGYIQFADTKSEGNLPDPKDKVEDMKLFQGALKYELEGNIRGAEEAYEQILARYPGIAASYINLALAQAMQQKFDAAIGTLKAGTERIPDSEILLARLGHTYLVMNRSADALETMQQVLTINPSNIDALTACAVVLGTWGQRDGARSYLEAALSLEPENKFLRVTLAGNLAMSGRIPEAIEQFKQLVRDYPEEGIFHQNLGIAYGMSEDYESSIQSLNEAIRLAPTPAAYYNLAVAYRETGQIEDAVKALEAYLQNPGNAPEANVQRARSELVRLRAKLK